MNIFYFFKIIFFFSNFFKNQNNSKNYIEKKEYSNFIKFEFIYTYLHYFLNNKNELDITSIIKIINIDVVSSFFFFIYEELSNTPNYMKILSLLNKKKEIIFNILIKNMVFFSQSLFVMKVKNLIIRETDITLYICFQSENLIKKWLKLYMLDSFKIINNCIFCIYIRLGNIKRYENISIILFKITTIINSSTNTLKNSNLAICFFFKVFLHNSFFLKEWYLLSFNIFFFSFFVNLIDFFFGKLTYLNLVDHYFNYMKIFDSLCFFIEKKNLLDFCFCIYLNFNKKKIWQFDRLTKLIGNFNRKEVNIFSKIVLFKCIQSLCYKKLNFFFKHLYKLNYKTKNKKKILLRLLFNMFLYQIRKKSKKKKGNVYFLYEKNTYIQNIIYKNNFKHKNIFRDIYCLAIIFYCFIFFKEVNQLNLETYKLFFFQNIYALNFFLLNQKYSNTFIKIYEIYSFISNYLVSLFIYGIFFFLTNTKMIFDKKFKFETSVSHYLRDFQILIFYNSFKFYRKNSHNYVFTRFIRFRYKSVSSFRILANLNLSWYIVNLYFKLKTKINNFKPTKFLNLNRNNILILIKLIKNLLKILIPFKFGIKIISIFKNLEKKKKLFINKLDTIFINYLFLMWTLFSLNVKDNIFNKFKNSKNINYVIFFNKIFCSYFYQKNTLFYNNFLCFNLKKKKNYMTILKNTFSLYKPNFILYFISKRLSDYYNLAIEGIFLIHFFKIRNLNVLFDKGKCNLFLSIFKFILFSKKLNKNLLSKKKQRFIKYKSNIVKLNKNFSIFSKKLKYCEKKLSIIRFFSSLLIFSEIKKYSFVNFKIILLRFFIWLISLIFSHKVMNSDPALKKYVKIIRNEIFSFIFIIDNVFRLKFINDTIIIWLIYQRKEIKKYHNIKDNINFHLYIFCLDYFSFLLNKIDCIKLQLKILDIFIKYKYLFLDKNKSKIFFNLMALLNKKKLFN